MKELIRKLRQIYLVAAILIALMASLLFIIFYRHHTKNIVAISDQLPKSTVPAVNQTVEPTAINSKAESIPESKPEVISTNQSQPSVDTQPNTQPSDTLAPIVVNSKSWINDLSAAQYFDVQYIDPSTIDGRYCAYPLSMATDSKSEQLNDEITRNEAQIESDKNILVVFPGYIEIMNRILADQDLTPTDRKNYQAYTDYLHDRIKAISACLPDLKAKDVEYKNELATLK